MSSSSLGYSGSLDLLSIVHDREPTQPDTGYKPLPNPDRRGNAAFCDGHAEFITRGYAHYQGHLFPTLDH